MLAFEAVAVFLVASAMVSSVAEAAKLAFDGNAGRMGDLHDLLR